MLLSVHATVGAIIGDNVNTPLLAFVLGFISHFILDIFPHGDEELIKAYRNDFKNNGVIYLIFFDLVSTLVLIPVLFISNKVDFNIVVMWGIIGSIIPDIFVALYEISNKYFRRTHTLHAFVHNKVGHIFGRKTNLRMPLKFGLFIQIILIYLLLF